MSPDLIKLAVASVLVTAFPFALLRLMDWLFEPRAKNADWKGRLLRRFVCRRLQFEWGRWCYQTDCCGETRATWWERAAVQD